MRAHFQAPTEDVFQCHYENCPKFYSVKRNLDSHIRSKHEGKRWTCDYCQRKLSTKQKLLQHITAHLDPNRAKKLLKKKSTLSRLVGVEFSQLLEHKIIDGEGAQISPDLLPLPESAHETSGTELSDF
jgi:general transcription factor IIIA